MSDPAAKDNDATDARVIDGERVNHPRFRPGASRRATPVADPILAAPTPNAAWEPADRGAIEIAMRHHAIKIAMHHRARVVKNNFGNTIAFATREIENFSIRMR